MSKKRIYFKKKAKVRSLAVQHIKELFKQAALVFDENPSRADNYVKLARRIAMKFKIMMSRELKRKFCKHCYSFLVPGKNCRVRSSDGKIVYSCFKCKKFMRFPIH